MNIDESLHVSFTEVIWCRDKFSQQGPVPFSFQVKSFEHLWEFNTFKILRVYIMAGEEEAVPYLVCWDASCVQCYRAWLLGHKYWLSCFLQLNLLTCSFWNCEVQKGGPGQDPADKNRVTEREIETQWIRCGVREIRTLPQEQQPNSSSPCMVK